MIRVGMSNQGELRLTLKDMLRHVLIVGATGSGKSKLLEKILRQLILLLTSFLLIDPKPGAQTARDTIAWVSEYLDDIPPSHRRQFYVLDDNFSLNPFDLPDSLTGRPYRRAIQKRIDWLACSMVRLDGSANYAEMPRKHRWTKNVLWFCGVRRGNKPPLGFHHAFDALHVGTGAWNRLWSSVKPHVPEFVAHDWEMIQRVPPRDRFFNTDSTNSGFRRVLTESTIPILSNDNPSLPVDDIVGDGGVGQFRRKASNILTPFNHEDAKVHERDKRFQWNGVGGQARPRQRRLFLCIRAHSEKTGPEADGLLQRPRREGLQQSDKIGEAGSCPDSSPHTTH